MPILTFPCPKCKKSIGFDYADYSFKEFADKKENYFEEIECTGCKKKLKTVPWIAVYDEEEEDTVTFV